MKGTLLLYLMILFLKGNSQHVSGVIKSQEAEQFIYFTYPTSFAYIKDSAAISPTGRFAKDFKLNEPKFITVSYGSFSKRLYIFPKGILQLSIDATNDSTFKHAFVVSGDHKINAYLSHTAQQQLHTQFLSSKIQMNQPIDSLAPVLAAFRYFSDSVRSAYFKPTKGKNIDKNLQTFLLIDSIEWNSYSLLASMDYSRIILSGNKDKFWQNEVRWRMPTSPSSHFFVAPYFNRIWLFYLRGEYDAQLRGPDSTQVNTMGFTRFALTQVESNKVNKRLEKSLLTQLMADILNMYTYRTIEESKNYDTLLTELKNKIGDAALIDEFDDQYSQKRAILLAHKKGQKAPDFRLYDSAGKEYHLEDFRGKVILVDIWASWCMPCIREFPYLHNLQELFKDEERFQLLSVSIDATAKEWKEKGLLKHRPPGLTLWVGENNAFPESYNISLIPILLLLDEKGNFIEFNPPRASSGDYLYQMIKDRIKML